MVVLPKEDGGLERRRLNGHAGDAALGGKIVSRVAYAAAHVVADPLSAESGGSALSIDWDATLKFRHYLWSRGLGVAEAMDTAQRGAVLQWDLARELIARTASEAAISGGAVVAGAGTDQLGATTQLTLGQVIHAYREQVEEIAETGADVVLLASRHLAAIAEGAADYRKVYGEVLSSLNRPAILHWLGPMFDPALGAYWGQRDRDVSIDVLTQIVEAGQGMVSGIKVSLLDPRREVRLRELVPSDVHVFTGDDYNYLELILGDGSRHSDALLGVFDPLADRAAAALRALDEGLPERYRFLLGPTVPLARLLFAEPTYNYKTDVVFLAYLNGHQDHFRMLGGAESGRSVTHLAEVVRLADEAGVLADPDLAAARVANVMTLAGVPRALAE